MNYQKSVTLLLFISLLMAANVSFSQSSSRFSRETYVGDKGDTLLYRMLFPDANGLRKYPLVVFLHGAGERGNDNEAQLKWGVRNFATDENMMRFPALVIAPQCPTGTGWSAFTRSDRTIQPDPTRTMELLIGLIQRLIRTMPVDSNRIYITGLSMGGYGTFDALARYPDLFAAAVPVCGGGDASRAASFAHVPIWIFHGAEDPVVDPAQSQQMLEALTKAGAHPGFTQYPESGHFSWLAVYSDPLMMAWLFRQHK